MTIRALAVALLPLTLWTACAALQRPAWERPPPPVRDAPVVEASRLSRVEFENGLHVLVLEDPRLPRFELGVVARRGAASVPEERAGLAAFTAELMERGAGERTALELAAVVDRLGATLSVAADWDSMQASVSGLSRDRDVLLDVLLDVLRRPRFDADEAERVRGEHLASLESAKDDPGTLASWQLARTLYDGHRFGAPLEGTPASVRTLTAAEARAFHAAVFTPANAILYATGDLDATELLEQVRARLGSWTGPDPISPGPPPPSPAPRGLRVVVVDRPDLGQTQLAFGHDGLARADERRIAAQLLNTVLGAGGFSSRLMSVVRAEEGLTYGIGSGFVLRRQPGPFGVWTFTRVPETRRVVDLVLAELRRLREQAPDAEELARAQSLRTGSFGLALETSAAVAGALVDLDVYGLPDDSLDTYRRRVRAVTPEETAALARTLIHPERLAVVAVGPAAELVPQLEGLGPVEVVTP